MLGSFKFRMFLVLMIAIFTSLSLEAGHSSKEVIEPVIKYILKDYGFEDKISSIWEIDNEKGETIPVSSKVIEWQKPCDFLRVESNYGWYWNKKKGRQEFSPGLSIKVKNNSLIKPAAEGVVDDIGENENGRYVIIKHGENLSSFYGGLKEILVQKGDKVDKDDVLGKSTDTLYLELRDEDGPINPGTIIE